MNLILGRWSGPWSFRCAIWRLWFGVNLRRQSTFVLWEGHWQWFSWDRPRYRRLKVTHD